MRFVMNTGKKKKTKKKTARLLGINEEDKRGRDRICGSSSATITRKILNWVKLKL